MDPHFLKGLVVFKNQLYPELIRTVHFYKSEEGVQKEVEREYLFYEDSAYEEMSCYRVFTLQKFCLSEQFKGLKNGVWLCLFVFDAKRGCPLDLNDIPTILSISRNSKLETIPSLANELQIIFNMSSGSKISALNEGEESNSKRKRGVALDLNMIPSPDQESEEENDFPSGTIKEKRKRARNKVLAGLSIKDVSKHFDLPIVEASKTLKVSLTVLKKKCRELGIPRWPHRKIKSLDGLIRNLQVEHQQSEDEFAAVAVAKRKQMIESERESIPFVEIQWETKKFRQHVFKKKWYRARALEIHNQPIHARE